MSYRFLFVSGVSAMMFAAGCNTTTPPAAVPAATGTAKPAVCEPVAVVPAAVQPVAGDASLGGKVASLDARVAALEAMVKKIAVSSGALPPEAVPMIGVKNDKQGVWKAMKVDAAPTVDGKLDDAAWKKAVQVKLLSDDEKKVTQETGVLVCHDGSKLYIAAICNETDMERLKVTCTERDQKIYSDDCIEFYIDPELDRTDAVKFVVNPNGVFMDFMRDLDGDAGDVTWNAEVKTTKEAARYLMEISIPFKDMGIKYKAGMEIGFNAYRQRQGNGKKGEYSTWCGQCNKIASIGKVVLE